MDDGRAVADLVGMEGDLGTLDDLMADLMDDRDDLEINLMQDEEKAIARNSISTK